MKCPHGWDGVCGERGWVCPECAADLRSHLLAQEHIIRELREQAVGCTLAGPGRGDCAHFVGLPGHSIPGQHDGPDDTVDVYGKPNGWCWSCWKDHKLTLLRAELEALRQA